jgi:hypothetical protein
MVKLSVAATECIPTRRKVIRSNVFNESGMLFFGLNYKKLRKITLAISVGEISIIPTAASVLLQAIR